MGKNNLFIEQEKRYRRMIREIVPQVYAAFAVSLHRRYGFGFIRIGRVLADTQDYWNAAKNKEIDIVQLCADETGIDIMSEITAEELGEKGDKRI